LEGEGIDEAVVHPLPLGAPRLAGGHADAELGVRMRLDESPGQRGLPRPRRGGEHQQQTAVDGFLAHSTFCTCSRIRSSSALSSTMRVETSVDWLLLPVVLTSRCISWTRKSILRPAGSLPARKPRKAWRWACSLVASSATSVRSAKSATSWTSRASSTGAPL